MHVAAANFFSRYLSGPLAIYLTPHDRKYNVLSVSLNNNISFLLSYIHTLMHAYIYTYLQTHIVYGCHGGRMVSVAD